MKSENDEWLASPSTSIGEDEVKCIPTGFVCCLCRYIYVLLLFATRGLMAQGVKQVVMKDKGLWRCVDGGDVWTEGS